MSAALTLSGGVALPRTSVSVDRATARVEVRVPPQITVSAPVTVTIDLQDYPLDSPIASHVRFSVHSNAQGVNLYVACTDLYESGNPASAYRIPVGGSGAEITCEASGNNRMLAWLSGAPAGALPAGWTGAVSEVGAFTAPPGDSFDQDVTVDVFWHTTDPSLPMGEYRGVVNLIGMVSL